MSGSLFIRVALAVGILAAGALVPAVTQAAPVDSPILLERWAAVYHDALFVSGYAKAMTVSPDGARVYVTGGTVHSPYPRKYATVAYDAATGAQIWVAVYTYYSNAYPYYGDQATSIAASHDGAKVYVAGPTRTIAYEADTGAELWVASDYPGRPGNYDYAVAELAVSPDGTRVYRTNERATVAYNAATGALLWADPQYGEHLAVSPDGARVFVTSARTRALDAGSGTQLWAADGDTWLSDVQVSPDGARVYVSGGIAVAPYEDFATIAYDATTGTQLWMAQYPGTYPRRRSLDVSPDGARVYVTGTSLSGGGSSTDYATLAYESTTGAQLWVARYKGPPARYNLAIDLAVSPDGTRVYVTGAGYDLSVAGSHWSTDTAATNATVVYDANDGAQLSVVQQVGPGYVIAVSPDGARVYVMGRGTPQGPVEHGLGRHVTWAYCTSALTVSTCFAGT